MRAVRGSRGRPVYNVFFELESDPFRVNPDPRFLYLSESHSEALATLVYAVRERKGFIALTGEVGTGKTTVLNAMLQKLDRSVVQTAYIFNTLLGVEDFFSYLLDELGLEPVQPFRKSAALQTLNTHLIHRLKRGLQTLLVIDEAQNLSVELLEEIRLLSNLETPQSKLLQILMVGQPELKEKLEQPELRQLRQRVELMHEITRLNAVETADYVRERLVLAGDRRGDIFDEACLRTVFAYAGGIPRIINVLCDNALLTAFSRMERHLRPETIKEAADALGLAVSERQHDSYLARPAPAAGVPAQRRVGPVLPMSLLDDDDDEEGPTQPSGEVSEEARAALARLRQAAQKLEQREVQAEVAQAEALEQKKQKAERSPEAIRRTIAAKLMAEADAQRAAVARARAAAQPSDLPVPTTPRAGPLGFVRRMFGR
jgi:general secretion pathway protein A